jgi:hypothetical protein
MNDNATRSLRATKAHIEALTADAASQYAALLQALVDKHQVRIVRGHMSDTWQVFDPNIRRSATHGGGMGAWVTVDSEGPPHPIFAELIELDAMAKDLSIGPSNLESFSPRKPGSQEAALPEPTTWAMLKEESQGRILLNIPVSYAEDADWSREFFLFDYYGQLRPADIRHTGDEHAVIGVYRSSFPRQDGVPGSLLQAAVFASEADAGACVQKWGYNLVAAVPFDPAIVEQARQARMFRIPGKEEGAELE